MDDAPLLVRLEEDSRQIGESYPETCDEHGLSRSTSAPASSLSGFFSIFFCRARCGGLKEYAEC